MPCARPALISLLAYAALGCGEASTTQPSPRIAPDKAELFGDPTLVPTRDGEAARRELAAAGELAAVLRASGWIDEVHVDVEHGAITRVVVGGRRSAAAPTELAPAVQAVAQGVLGDELELVLAIAEPVASEPPLRGRELPLLLAALGLGASVALVLDRTLRRRRAPRRRRS
jgi:hypothetical protein